MGAPVLGGLLVSEVYSESGLFVESGKRRMVWAGFLGGGEKSGINGLSSRKIVHYYKQKQL